MVLCQISLVDARGSKLALTSDELGLGASELEIEATKLLSLCGKFLHHCWKSKVSQSSINFNTFKISHTAAV